MQRCMTTYIIRSKHYWISEGDTSLNCLGKSGPVLLYTHLTITEAVMAQGGRCLGVSLISAFVHGCKHVYTNMHTIPEIAPLWQEWSHCCQWDNSWCPVRRVNEKVMITKQPEIKFKSRRYVTILTSLSQLMLHFPSRAVHWAQDTNSLVSNLIRELILL